MEELKKQLIESFKAAERVALLCVGSELRGDDIAGILVARELNKSFRRSGRDRRFKIFVSGTAPENWTGEIKRFNPSHLVIIDSADMGEKPGTVKLISPDKISGFSFSTHRLPLKMTAEYLLHFLACRITIIGIQPKTLEFGKPPSKEVEKSSRAISSMLKKILCSR